MNQGPQVVGFDELFQAHFVPDNSANTQPILLIILECQKLWVTKENWELSKITRMQLYKVVFFWKFEVMRRGLSSGHIEQQSCKEKVH